MEPRRRGVQMRLKIGLFDFVKEKDIGTGNADHSDIKLPCAEAVFVRRADGAEVIYATGERKRKHTRVSRRIRLR